MNIINYEVITNIVLTCTFHHLPSTNSPMMYNIINTNRNVTICRDWNNFPHLNVLRKQSRTIEFNVREELKEMKDGRQISN